MSAARERERSPVDAFVSEAHELIRLVVLVRREFQGQPVTDALARAFAQVDRCSVAFYDEVATSMAIQLHSLVTECPTMLEILEENARLRVRAGLPEREPAR